MPYRSPSKTRSRASSLAIVIGLHGAAIAAALLAKSAGFVAPPDEILTAYNVPQIDEPNKLPPPPEPEAETPPARPAETTLTVTPPSRPQRPALPPIGSLIPGPPGPPQPPVTRDPPPVPVLIDARFAASALGRLQPPYPPALIRAEIEGEVTVRVTIGPDGRVKRIDKISADHDAFFEATRRHALRVWRFEPATRDGRPIESAQVHTVRFEIRG